ncbi:MAG: LLM class flavin-dependent oxidoreductase [Acidimicrobiia bacterium]|nr:LLM class flavin-dependent oxidoreductase [Acidimicrobiia bacterium]MDH5238243.1 LLM class flavin-dependent oxidoreductase [Acidimicrobiia bacterium]
MLLVRFDMRSPGASPEARADLYRAAIEMSAWAEEHGAVTAVVSEHHASPDGYLPAPLILASAIAARTTSLPITVGAVLAGLHDPVALAEQMVVLDHISRGRVSYTIGLGYRPVEYEMFGRDFADRGRRMDEVIAALQAGLSGEPFEYQGRPVHVTPAPYTPGGPMLSYGGGSLAAARRAGRFGLGFLGQGSDDPAALESAYRMAAEEAGHQPGFFYVPSAGSATAVVVVEDVDRGWAEHGPHLLHDAQMYGTWVGPDDAAEAGSAATTVAELRAENGNYRVVDPEGAREIIADQGVLPLFPLAGGTPPDLAWSSLDLVAREVLTDG